MSFHVRILSIPDEYVKTWILHSLLFRLSWVHLTTISFFVCTTALFLEIEAIREDRSICGSRVTTISYGELGSVETSYCCCFICVDSNLGM
jgi:hypothetical protein